MNNVSRRSAKDMPSISVVIPVRDAERLLPNCLKSLEALDYPKDKYEVILADGISKDRTRDIALEHGIRVIENPKKTVVSGRNIGFKESRGYLVAFSDVDCIMDKHWLKNCVKYFADNNVACVGGPNLTPEDETSFGKAAGFVFNQSLFAAGSIHARVLKDVREVKSIPGCNAIYRRDVLEKVMPMSEDLIEAEDAQMNQRIRQLGYRLLYTPDVFVWHYRRPTPGKLLYQMYRYAIGRVIVGRIDPNMLNAAYVTAGLAIPIFAIVTAVLLLAGPVYFHMLLAIIAAFILFYSLRALIQTRSMKVALYVPYVIFIMTVAWSSGFMRQLIWPAKPR